MADELTELVSKAQTAIAQQDKRAAQVLLRRVLEQEFNHPKAWDLLYTQFGEGLPLQDFRRAYTKKYFPYEALAEQCRHYEDSLTQAKRAMPGFQAGLAVGYLASFVLIFLAGGSNTGAAFCLASPGAIAGIAGGYIGDNLSKRWGKGRASWIYSAIGGGLISLVVTPVSWVVLGLIVRLLSDA